MFSLVSRKFLPMRNIALYSVRTCCCVVLWAERGLYVKNGSVRSRFRTLFPTLSIKIYTYLYVKKIYYLLCYMGDCTKCQTKTTPLLENQVTTQNFMHLPYLGVELCSCLLSLSFLSSFLTSRTQTHESGWNREVSNTPSHSTKILGKLICYVHASVDLKNKYFPFKFQSTGNNIYRLRAIITHSWLETALEY